MVNIIGYKGYIPAYLATKKIKSLDKKMDKKDELVKEIDDKTIADKQRADELAKRTDKASMKEWKKEYGKDIKRVIKLSEEINKLDEKREAKENIIYKAANPLIAKRIRMEKQISNLENKINGLEAEKHSLETKQEEIKAKIEQTDKIDEKGALKSELMDSLKRIDKIIKEINKMTKQLSSLNKKLQNFMKKIDKMQDIVGDEYDMEEGYKEELTKGNASTNRTSNSQSQNNQDQNNQDQNNQKPDPKDPKAEKKPDPKDSKAEKKPDPKDPKAEKKPEPKDPKAEKKPDPKDPKAEKKPDPKDPKAEKKPDPKDPNENNTVQDNSTQDNTNQNEIDSQEPKTEEIKQDEKMTLSEKIKKLLKNISNATKNIFAKIFKRNDVRRLSRRDMAAINEAAQSQETQEPTTFSQKRENFKNSFPKKDIDNQTAIDNANKKSKEQAKDKKEEALRK